MENASKALIIAGAILLAILLISLGIMIFTQAQGTIKGAGMSEAQVSAFNQKFTKYQGKQKGSTIRAMVQEVMANNNSEEASDETMVYISGPVVSLKTGANESPNFSKKFSNTEIYKVRYEYDKGRVSGIIVEFNFKNS